MSNLTVSVTDLNPGDGIAPSFVFGPINEAWAHGSASAYYESGSDDGYILQFEGLGAPLDVSLANAQNSVAVTAKLYGRDQPFTHVLELLAVARPPNHTYVFSAINAGNFGFTLSPNTRVDIAMSVHASGNTDPQNNFDAVSVSASLVLDLLLSEDLGADLTYRAGDGPSQPDSFDVSETLRVTYSNELDTEATGVLTFVGLSIANSGPLVLGPGPDPVPDPDPIPVPVPEPASWAMMLGGLGVIGASLRRRRNRNESSLR
jgi:hypothetical protein